MSSDAAVSMYVAADQLMPAERVVLEQLQSEVRDAPILDVGVGGGRTVAPLLAMSRSYIGIDYTPAMVDACRRRFPGVRFDVADARELSVFADGQFKLVVFSSNGLCMVGHDDRMTILSELCRVLSSDGLLVFSTYNQRSTHHAEGFTLPQFVPSRNPIRSAWRLIQFARETVTGIYNRARLSRYDRRGAEYSIINDRCHNYATMLYYVSVAYQRKQLAETGFNPSAEAFGLHGQRVGDDTTDSSITFIARKDASSRALHV